MDNADLRLLRVFCTIVECGGFSAAQVQLNTSASRISTQMADLEARLGMRLCQRGRTGFSVTQDGRAVYEEAKKLFAHVEDFRLALGERQKKLTGEVRLGLIDNMLFNKDAKFAAAIGAFKRKAENVKLDIKVLPPTDLEAGLLEGMLHVAIGYFHHRVSTLEYEPLFREQHYLYCGHEHPLFDRPDGEITDEDLLKYDYANRRYIDQEGELASTIPLRGSAETENMEALAALILSGAYIAYLPDNYAEVWVEQSLIRSVAPERVRQEATLHLATRKGLQSPRALETFLDELRAAHAY